MQVHTQEHSAGQQSRVAFDPVPAAHGRMVRPMLCTLTASNTATDEGQPGQWHFRVYVKDVL